LILEKTSLEDCFILRPRIFEDERGLFFESFNQKTFNSLIGKAINFVQDNQSVSQKNVLRGLHFQTGKFAQSKLVRVIEGEVIDVAVDLRPNSKTFKKYFSTILNQKNNAQLFVPKGFAHGFLVLSETAILSYKCDNYYNKNAESGIIFNDATLNIDWNISEKDVMLSEKDRLLPTFETLFR
jgi:dTDP-4-dehydrorhamnose 3,5-epimerase